jgi:protocatechuate 3,4-dioxygenase beta subunit
MILGKEEAMKSSFLSKPDRRSFLKQAVMFAAVAPVLESGTLGLIGCNRAQSLSRSEQPENVSWKTTIVSDKEPGEPLIISGTIFAPDGRTPLEGINLFVYQTDATGVYSTSGGDNWNTRIHGLMRTNSEGRYEFRTIKPAPYPGHRDPAHIHVHISGPGYPEYWTDSYLFEGDPFIDAETFKNNKAKGRFSFILSLTRGKDGVWRGARDFQVERCSRNCTGRS